ncbi:MAG: hypothetical protein ACI85O_002693 [Saprospiraceae bacterium]
MYSSEVEEMQTLTVSTWSNETSKVDIEFLSQYKSQYFKDKDFQWACDSCLSLKKAIKANPTKQTYCDFKPILAYYDQTYNCDSCKSDFVFSKQEQKFWYEERSFWVQSKPKHCKECRKKKRKEKEYHKRISQLKKKGENLKVEEIAELAEIYDHFGNEAKRNMYLNRIKNR